MKIGKVCSEDSEDESMKEKDKGKKSGIWMVLFVIFLILAILGVVMLILQIHNRMEEEKLYQDLQSEVNVTQTDSGNELTAEEQTEEGNPIPEEETIEQKLSLQLGIDIPEKNLDFDKLHEDNEDIYAWIYVPDTTVDYPILQHPTDNTYYLNYNMDGSYGYPGCIYTEDYNQKDFSDPHTVIYGHNLKDRTMFTTLHNFEDPELMQEDHYIFIYTEDYVYVYRIFGAYEYPAVHLLDNYDLSNEYVYEQFLKDIMSVDDTPARVANIRHDISVTKEDKIVTLSTCTPDDISTIRFLVTGVLLDPRQEDEVGE